MDRARREHAVLDPARASEQEIEEALVHWDELDEASLSALEQHPRHGARLRKLRAAERWLSEPERMAGDCPAPEELYDFGRGPGARPLLSERRAALEHHVAGCADCRGLVATLASPPPLPLEVLDHDAEHDAPEPLPARTLRRPRRVAPWAVPLAAAAALLLFFVPFPWKDGSAAGSRGGLPEAPLLRGEDPGALRFPRDRTLFVTESGVWHGLPTGSAPRFELHVPAGTSAVRVELALTDGSAFAAGEPVAELAHELDVVGESPVELEGPALGPGAYTWRAWARVNGLEQELGARDFEVVRNVDLEGLLARLAALREPQRSEAAVRLLQDAGFLAEARSVARAMPQSDERDRYLGRTPGR